jgi:DNA-binding IclR family transcriptional regulator
MKEKSLLLRLTGEMPFFRIIDFLIENKGMDFTKKDISEGAGISRASLFNYWKELERHNIVRVTRQFGKTKLYTLNAKNMIARKLLELEKVLIEEALEKEAEKKKEILVTA